MLSISTWSCLIKRYVEQMEFRDLSREESPSLSHWFRPVKMVPSEKLELSLAAIESAEHLMRLS